MPFHVSNLAFASPVVFMSHQRVDIKKIILNRTLQIHRETSLHPHNPIDKRFTLAKKKIKTIYFYMLISHRTVIDTILEITAKLRSKCKLHNSTLTCQAWKKLLMAGRQRLMFSIFSISFTDLKKGITKIIINFIIKKT